MGKSTCHTSLTTEFKLWVPVGSIVPCDPLVYSDMRVPHTQISKAGKMNPKLTLKANPGGHVLALVVGVFV